MTTDSLASRLPALIMAALVLVFGLWIVFHGLTYDIGTAARMGPGFFPVAMGAGLSAVAVLNLIDTARNSEPAGVFKFRPLISIAASLLAFVALLEPFGLVPATCAMVLLAAMAERQPKPLTALFTAAGLCVFGAVIFVYGLGLPIKLIRW